MKENLFVCHGMVLRVSPETVSSAMADLAANETEFVNQGLEMRPLGQWPEFGMRVSVATHESRDLRGIIEAIGPEQVEIIIRPAHSVAADPVRRRTGHPNMLHDSVLEVFDSGW
jgi:hypothetical protein